MLRSRKNAFNHPISKTMPDETDNSQIRVSLGDEAKQRLRQISKISVFSLQSRSRDWGRKDIDDSLKITAFGVKSQLQNERKCQLRRKDKNTKFYRNQHHLFKTLSSLRQDRFSDKKSCKSIKLQFQKDQKQPEDRIHSKHSNPITLYNSTFYVTQRLFDPKTSKRIEIEIPNKRNEYRKFKEKSYHNAHLAYKTNNLFKGLSKKKCTSTINQPKQSKREQKKESANITSKTAYFINAILRQQEHKSIFCPTKYLLSKKQKEISNDFK